MHYFEIAPIKIIRTDSVSFTYSSPYSLAIGQLVLIEVGKEIMPGLVIQKTSKPSYSTKQVISIIEETPLPSQLLKLAHWISKYYLTPFPITIQAMLPSGLQKKRVSKPIGSITTKRERTNIVLNNDQRLAIGTIQKNKPGTFLIQGITGSGKTEVYINLIKQAVANKKSAIIIVPEISLTSQLVSELSLHFDKLIISHSKMTESARHRAWKLCLNSKEPIVVIGPRSALFMPLNSIGVIVIDEAHEPSLKQEQSPKYSALRVATMLGRFHNATVIFGSATPNIIDKFLADNSNSPIIKLTNPARANSKPPNIHVVDIKKRDSFKQHNFLSDLLLSSISNNLKDNKQTLLFHNRRGSANITICNDCGWTSECLNCHVPLTLHIDKHILCCHICGYKQKIPNKCPICSQANIIHKGVGTKLIESEIKKIFPTANVARFDADNSISESLNEKYDDLYDGSIDIIIGTQIIAKGLDLPKLRTVGIIQADAGLSMPDYITNERVFQLLAQVIGRVGRNEHSSSVIIQSYQPNNPSVQFGIKQDYDSFYKYTLNERKINNFPPFTHLLKLVCTYKTEQSTVKNCQKIAQTLRECSHKDVQILGPTPAFHERERDHYRWQIILKSPKREYLINALKYIPKTHWQFELEPTSLL